MGQEGKIKHEKKLDEILKDYQNRGYKTIRLKAKSPDAIAFNEKESICIEIIGKYGKEKKYKLIGGWTKASKIRNYEGLGFDKIEVYDFPYYD
jgi:Holliday junction resolvase